MGGQLQAWSALCLLGACALERSPIGAQQTDGGAVLHADGAPDGANDVGARVDGGDAPDAGRDASAGRSDAGIASPDGGLDAGEDAGSDGGLDAGQNTGSDGGLDAGQVDGGLDAGQVDAGQDAGPSSCDDRYAATPGYSRCEERATACEFLADLRGGLSCAEVCEARGGSCIAQYRDDGGSCERIEMRPCGYADSNTDICVCTRP